MNTNKAEQIFYAQIGASIRAMREQQRKTPQEMAMILDVPVAQYLRFEAGTEPISLFQMYVLINATQPELITPGIWPQI